jgi:uncharacterized small protein (DUF1192 family)
LHICLQAAMSSTEERVRATEAAERAALVAEYEGRVAALLGEVERLRHELAHRTAAMAAEMDRWAAGQCSKTALLLNCAALPVSSAAEGCRGAGVDVYWFMKTCW